MPSRSPTAVGCQSDDVQRSADARARTFALRSVHNRTGLRGRTSPDISTSVRRQWSNLRLLNCRSNLSWSIDLLLVCRRRQLADYGSSHQRHKLCLCGFVPANNFSDSTYHTSTSCQLALMSLTLPVTWE